VTSKKFVVPRKMQFYMEIFYEPFLYDLEIYLESDDADLVRSHLNKAMPNVDWSKYKGSKQILVELEHGEYEIKIIQKLPGINDELYDLYQPKFVQFQIRLFMQDLILP